MDDRSLTINPHRYLCTTHYNTVKCFTLKVQAQDSYIPYFVWKEFQRAEIFYDNDLAKKLRNHTKFGGWNMWLP